MNLKVLAILLIYYATVSAFFIFAGDVLSSEGYNVNASLNSSQLSGDEIDTGGLFGSGISFSRFAAIVTFGIGLPGSIPIWFAVMFAIWQTALTVFTVGFVISSIWDG